MAVPMHAVAAGQPEPEPGPVPAHATPVAWPDRAAALRAMPFPAADGYEKLAALWSGGPLLQPLDPASRQRLAGYLKFVSVGPALPLIRQDEAGDFMLIVLEGAVTVERSPAADRTARLAEARAGDVLGEMALLDAGPRFSSCTTRTPCVLAVLDREALARLMQDDTRLAMVLMAALARRLSLRLRQVSARLSALLTDG